MWFASRAKAADPDTITARRWQDRGELLDEVCGVGLWEALLPDGDARHAEARWTWSPGFRRLIGFERPPEFPDDLRSWSDRLHPDDAAPTLAALDAHLADRSGGSRYDQSFRLKLRDGGYRWFRAIGGSHRAADDTVRLCGSLVDVHDGKTAEAALAEAEAERGTVETLGRALAAFAEGDLAVRITQPLGPRTEPLRLDFNRAVGEIRQTMDRIASKQDAIRSGAAAITGAADDLSERTEQQAASLEQTAAALDQITVTVKKTAEGAKHARDVVGVAKGDAERSGEVVRRAVEAMGSIDKSSGQIGQIIGVIDEIAFQTNLLALNAGVEAARAGEAGRGFAVVASEVRALAQRSAEAAKEIKGLITASDAQVKVGVGLVGETGKALSRIVEQVGQINTAVAEIAASAGEQAAGLQQVNTAVNQMDQVTQKNAAMVQQTTAAARGLSGDADELAELTEHFRTGEPAGRPRPAPTRFPVREASTVPARKPVGRGGAARKPEPAIDADWEEF